MHSLTRREMSALKGGADCDTLAAINAVSCLGAQFGLVATLILGPTCVGTAIGYAVEC